MYQEGSLYVVGGTSASSPSFAGVMALVVQHAAVREGNANVAFYTLASKQRAGGASVVHDVTGGNNSVPGQMGFNATGGYDQATGLGSVDGAILVDRWSDATIVPSFHATASPSSLSIKAGSNKSVAVSVTVSGGFHAAVTFSVAGLPSGVSAVFSPVTLAAPGSGSIVFKLTAASASKAGSYSVTVSATSSGSATQHLPLLVSVTR
jgi:subtilase family serine protease